MESENLHVIQTAEPIEQENCILFPCPIKEKHSTKNPMAWMGDRQESDKICIAIAPGNVKSIPEAKEHPIPLEAPSRYGLDYVALGHWHSYKTYADKDEAKRMAYCGAHETTKFGEPDSGKVILVKIAKRGAMPILEPIPTGNLNWQNMGRNHPPDKTKTAEKGISTVTFSLFDEQNWKAIYCC